jgi:hypothetical protein
VSRLLLWGVVLGTGCGVCGEMCAVCLSCVTAMLVLVLVLILVLILVLVLVRCGSVLCCADHHHTTGAATGGQVGGGGDASEQHGRG